MDPCAHLELELQVAQQKVDLELMFGDFRHLLRAFDEVERVQLELAECQNTRTIRAGLHGNLE